MWALVSTTTMTLRNKCSWSFVHVRLIVAVSSTLASPSRPVLTLEEPPQRTSSRDHKYPSTQVILVEATFSSVVSFHTPYPQFTSPCRVWPPPCGKLTCASICINVGAWETQFPALVVQFRGCGPVASAHTALILRTSAILYSVTTSNLRSTVDIYPSVLWHTNSPFDSPPPQRVRLQQ